MTRFKLAVLLALPVASALAQVPPVLPPSIDPGAIQRQSQDQQRQIQNEEQQRKFRDQENKGSPLDAGGAQQAPSKAPAAPDSVVRVRVRQMVFSESAVFTPQELTTIAADYEGKELSFADLQAVLQRVNTLYLERGFVAARATLPAQDVSGGVVQIRLIEGRIGDYLIQGNDTTRESFVRDRMHQLPGALVNAIDLERDLIWFNRTNDIQLGADLRAGSAVGTSDVHLGVLEPQQHVFKVTADSTGGHSTGENRIGMSYINHSLFGFRDELTLSETASDGDTGNGFSYSVPVGTWGTRAVLNYNHDRTHVLYGPFSTLNITGGAESTGISVVQPLVATQNNLVHFTVGYVTTASNTFIEPVQLANSKTNDTSLGLDMSRSDGGGNWFASLTETSGNQNVPGKENYQTLRATVQRDQTIDTQSYWHFNLTAQGTANDFLPGSDQFFLGGTSTVRGYSSSAYGGLSGYVINIEYHHDWPQDKIELPPGLQVFPFVFFDHGETRPTGAGLTSIDLQSVGAGADLRLSTHTSGRITFGQQLTSSASESSAYRIDFSLQWVY